MRILFTALLVLCSSFSAFASPRTGVAAIGLEHFHETQIDALATIFVAIGGNLEVSLLPYSFDRSGSYANLSRLLEKTLPTLKGHLFVTVYLDDGPNRRTVYRPTHVPFRSDLDQYAFWRILNAQTAQEKQKKAAFLAAWGVGVVGPYHEWAVATVNWAKQAGLRSKFTLVIVPVLEDDASDANTYKKLLEPTMELLSDLSIKYRRNPNGSYSSAKRITLSSGRTIPYELHTNQRQKVLSNLRDDDVVTNDGSYVTYPGENPPSVSEPPITTATFRESQRAYISSGISSLIWRPEFNGGPREIPPYKRPILFPLDSASSRSRLQATLEAR